MDDVPQKVWIEGLNYGQVVPETIDSEIRLVKFQPTASINDIAPGNQVKFLMQGNGFLDPYSTYLRFTVACQDLIAGEVRFLDRSAHSFIQRLLISSNSTECERIDDYDILAAMINDQLYSSEQHQFHAFEGFPSQTYNMTDDYVVPRSDIYRYIKDFDTSIGSDPATQNPNGQALANMVQISSFRHRRDLSMLHGGSAASSNVFTKVGEPCFFNTSLSAPLINFKQKCGKTYSAAIYDRTTTAGVDTELLDDDDNPGTSKGNKTTTLQFEYDHLGSDVNQFLGGTYANQDHEVLAGENGDHLTAFDDLYKVTTTDDQGKKISDLMTYDYIKNGVAGSFITYKEGVQSGSGDNLVVQLQGSTRIQFTIPIYSSLIGVLMPQKRLIPLNVLPLEVEFTMNPYALYSGSDGGSRNYKITRMEIFSHMLYFYNDIPKAIDAIVADSGIFFHMSTFYRAPITSIGTATVPAVAQIQMSYNAINSVHFVFIYDHYRNANNPYARKLHFVSHNLSRLQIQNGTFQIPNEPIESIGTSGNAGTNLDNSHAPFLVEYLKSFNRLHDPTVDCGLYANNYSSDTNVCQNRPFSYTFMSAICKTEDLLVDPVMLNFDDKITDGSTTADNTIV